MSRAHLFTVVLPLVGGLLLALLAIDFLIGRKDRRAKRSRIVLASIVALAEGGLIVWRILSTSHPDPFVTRPQLPLMSSPPDETILATEAQLNRAKIPVHDPNALQTLLALDPRYPTQPAPSPDHRVGDRRQFVLRDRALEAELVHVSGSVYAWLAIGIEADREALQSAVDRFAAETLPAVQRYFALERSQEDQAAIHILHYEDPGDDTRGFLLPDTGIFHVNLAHRGSEQEFYLGTLAHQLQHALHWHTDPNEERWLDEGLSELAQLIAGLDPGRSDEVFRQAFDTQLNHWPYDGEGERPSAHYGASYRYLLYLWEQFGDGFVRDLSHHPANGLPSIDAVLAAHKPGSTADTVFADWVLANAVDVGAYRYDREDWEASLPTWYEATFYRYPMDIQSAVHPYATDYFRLENTHPSTIRFSGTTQTRLLPKAPHSGETCWWSNATHHSDSSLTTSLDLSGLSTATVRFWTWYDIESAGSRAYLSASRDKGKTWTLLQSYRGLSDGWVKQQLDLTAFAGAQVQLRFDYLTGRSADDRGILLDDLAIPELGDGAVIEDWQAEGFIRAGEMVPVRWVVQVIDVYREGHSLDVHRMVLDDRQNGQLEIELRPLGGLLGNQGRGILAISALARGSTEPLPYHCEITRE